MPCGIWRGAGPTRARVGGRLGAAPPADGEPGVAPPADGEPGTRPSVAAGAGSGAAGGGASEAARSKIHRMLGAPSMRPAAPVLNASKLEHQRLGPARAVSADLLEDLVGPRDVDAARAVRPVQQDDVWMSRLGPRP